MAFATKYKTSFLNRDGDTITAEIQEDLYTGTAEEFDAIGGDPIVITHETNINTKEAGIIPSYATIGLYINNKWDLHDLLYATDRQYQVVIKNGTVELFVGWMIASVSVQEYKAGRYMAMIEATDGLSDLKDIAFDNDGAKYAGFDSMLSLLRTLLSKTGLTLQIAENCDIAGVGMTALSTSVSPLTQAYIHRDAYNLKDKDADDCATVLNRVLQALHCRLFQTIDANGDNSVTWMLQKLNTIAESGTIVRRFNTSGLTINANWTSVDPISLGASMRHIGGEAQISMQPAYKEINLIGDRGTGFSLLDGYNFNSDDFSGSTLNDWGAPSILTDVISGWSTATYSELTIGDDTFAALRDTTGAGQVSPVAFSDAGGNVSVAAGGHGLSTSDWVLIPRGEYKGIWKVQSVPTSSSFIITATFSSTASTTGEYYKHTSATCLEYDRAIALDSDQIAVDNDYQYINVNAKINLRQRGTPGVNYAVVIVLVAYINSTNFKVLNSDGLWVDRSANEVHPIIMAYEKDGYGDQTINIKGSLSDENNFYTSGSPKFYLGIFANYRGTASLGTDDTIRYNSIDVFLSPGATKETTIPINPDYNDSLDVDFFHTDGDSDDNDEFLYQNPIFDNSTARACFNSWQQAGGSADNLEDIIAANLATSYGYNSQIWSGVLKGDLKIYNTINIPAMLNRNYQIQKISKNLANNYNSVSLIEVTPSPAYYIERASDSVADTYSLSTSHGDLTAIFKSGDKIFISDIRRKSDGALVETGDVEHTLLNDSTYGGGRTVLTVNTTFSISPGASLEVKGVLRKV